MKALPVERFWDKVEKTNDCWWWTGAKTRGYGMFRWEGRQTKAHRAAWRLANGPIPEGAHVLHKCDNPGCVRPDHLYLGDNAQNMRDRDERGRGIRGERAHRAKLTANDIPVIRQRHRAGDTLSAIAADYSVTRQNVRAIVLRRSWAHV